MFIVTEFRGKDIASELLLKLERWTLKLNFIQTILETRINQPEVITLHKNHDIK